ncbi:peroxisomal membrane protein 2-like [Babylonia areolata]|uniref:peroxisomal membrane protein 2-like n=1 Tax=Babylonia areolata TaxID=304850 RepID=UPI003FD335AC
MSASKDAKKGNILERALKEYVRLLQQRPVLTKSVTSACVSGLSATISQLIVADPASKGRINWRNIFAYASFGFVMSGPLFHHLYAFLEKYLPAGSPSSSLRRLLFDRLIFTPPYLAIFLYWLARVEGQGQEAAIQRLKATYWTILKMNWVVWTLIQYINFNHVPLKFRTVFANLCAMVYLVVVSVLRRKAAARS